MASPSDPDEVEPTLLPGAAPQIGSAGAPVAAITPPPVAPDATLAYPVASDDGATLVSATAPAAQGETNDAADVTRISAAHSAPDAGTVVGSNVAEPGATLPSPAGRTAASGAMSGGISGDLSHDTSPISVSAGPGVSVPAPQTSGTMVGRFALKGLHASGGLGEVFTARDTELNREVAVKRIKSRYADDPGSRRRFLTEAELTARLDHPGVVPVFGLVNDARGRPVYAMRFIRGETLKDEIDRYHGPTAAGRALGAEKTEKVEKAEPNPAEPGADPVPASGEKEIPRTVAFRNLLSRFVYVCKAIAYAHDKGIIHRDIKPANVMVGKFGEVLVVDWGLAKSLSDGPDFDRIMRATAEAGFRHDPEATDLPSHMTMAGTAVGTPSYMPPEQAAGEIDKVGPRADVYSLGATLFAILTGRAPFVGKSAVETLNQVRRGAFEPPAAVNADCPKPLDAICRKAMALNQNDRYATALDLATDVERWLSDEPVSAYRDPLTARLARWARRHPARIATGASLLLAGVLAAGGIAWAINEGRKSTQTALDLVTEKEKETAAERDKVTAQEKETAKALVQVTKEKERTEAEKVRVGLARDVARSRYEKAVEAYNTLVHDLDKKLADRAGMQAIRKTLLLNATDGLKKLIEGKVEGDIGADRTLVSAHRQMGEVYQLVGETTRAREQFLEAVKVARDVKGLAAEGDTRPLEARAADLRAADRDLARALDKLAGIHVQAGDTTSALAAINEAVTIFEALAADKTDVVAQQDLAAARARRSVIRMERGETGKAVDDCKLALAARQQLSEDAIANLDRTRDFADSLDALAGLQLRTGDTNGASESALTCLNLRTKLAPKFPRDRADVQRERADAHARLGEVHFDRALMSAAAKDYEDGIRVLDELMVLDPQNAGAAADRALLYGRLGQVQIRTGDIVRALDNGKKSKEGCQALETIDPKSAKAQRDLALARRYYGDALLAGGYAKDALVEYEASFALLTALQELDQESAAAKLERAHGWQHIGDCKLALKDPKGAVSAFQACVEIFAQAEAKDGASASLKRDLAVGLYKQADAHCAEGKPAPANQLASRATKMLVDLAAANKGSAQAQRDIALAYGKWGQVLANDGHPTGALIVWQSSLDRFQKLARLDKENVQAKEEEASAWERLAGFYATLGNSTQALASARHAIALWVALKNNADSRTKAGQRRLALALIRCGDINTEVRQLSAAKDWYEQARDEVKRMKDDPLLGPVAELANEKLVFLEAVKVGLSNPKNLADKKYDATRVAALRMVATLEIRADHPPEAANVAYELERVAKTPEDLFAVAHTFAGCAAATRGTDSAKISDAKKAVAALRKAIDAGFRDADALATPEWDAVNRRDPDFSKVRTELVQRRSASNN